MELVIKIPEEIYESQRYAQYFGAWSVVLQKHFENAIPLPKGHGRLGDLDKIKKDMQNYLDDCETTSKYTRLGFETAIAVVEDADTIIEEIDDYYRGAQEEC